MNHRTQQLSTLAVVVLLIVFSTQCWSQNRGDKSTWGLGISPQYEVPIFNFQDRFKGGPNAGLKFSYTKNGLDYEVLIFSTKFSHGKIEDRTFQWNLDGQYYTSPEALSEFESRGLLGILKKPLSRSFGPLTPYWSIGAGFIYYQHSIQNLIFPGQSILPLDPSFTYSPEPENQTAFSLNYGGGLRYAISTALIVDLNLRHTITFGYLRPMEAWLLEKVSPMQSLGIGIEMTYYLGR